MKKRQQWNSKDLIWTQSIGECEYYVLLIKIKEIVHSVNWSKQTCLSYNKNTAKYKGS